jgi:hypothetical protein
LTFDPVPQRAFPSVIPTCAGTALGGCLEVIGLGG